MGTVYRARDRYSGDFVALKLLHAAGVGQDAAERFHREAQLLADLHHPGIVSYAAHGTTPDGQRFLAMEWLDGEDLGCQLLRGPLPIQQCIVLLSRLADALAVTHQRGVVHRDLKPSNLFLVGKEIERVKILDFGIARRMTTPQALTRTGVVIGTPEYMSPEQARGSRDLSPATDIFSLGCVLYECLTGQPPFIAEHVAVVLARILFEDPIPVEDRRPGVPIPLARLLEKLLAKDPLQRVADAAALRAELAALGEQAEPALAATAASPGTAQPVFAEKEQSLLCVVLAALPQAAPMPQAALPLPEAAMEEPERQALFQALRALGTSPQFLANGSLLLLVPPLGSAQDQATLAARAALCVKERWAGVVVAMATGRGALQGHTAVGEVVEQAAGWLRAVSQPSGRPGHSGVFLDGLSAKLLEGRFALASQAGGALLLGEEKEVDASRPLLGKPTPCVGRETELGMLEAQLAGCIEESEARAVLILAPPGTGKSRLRHEFLLRVTVRGESVTTLLGRGDMMSAGAPYGILGQAIRRWCGLSGSEPLSVQRERLAAQIGEDGAEENRGRVTEFIGELCGVPFPAEQERLIAARQDPHLLHEQIRRAFLEWLSGTAQKRPVLLVLDDLQWGDALSVELLNEALRELRGVPWLVLALGRPEVREIFPKLWQGQKLQEIALKGLSKKACERLVRQVLSEAISAEEVRWIVEQSAGNALFLEELIRAAAEKETGDRPDTVLAMLQARIGRLETGPRRAVEAASVFGQTFWRGGVLALLGPHVDGQAVDTWLDTLVHAETVERRPRTRFPNDIEYCFRHALVRDAAYTLLSPTDQELGHRMVCAYLEQVGERDPMVLAEHAHAGRDLERAVMYYASAATECYRRSDLMGMAAHVERGISCGARGEALGQLLAIKMEVCLWRSDFSTASATGLEAAALLPPGSFWWSKTLGTLSIFFGNTGDPSLRDFVLENIHKYKPTRDGEVAYWEALSQVVSSLSMLGLRKLAAPLAERLQGIDLAQLAQEPLARGHIGFALYMYKYFLDLDPWFALEQICRSTEGFEQAQSRRWQALTRGASGTALEALGDYIEAERILRAFLAVARSMPDPLTLNSALLHLLLVLAESCEPDKRDEATALAEELIQLNSMEPTVGGAHGALARIRLAQGRLAEAQEAAERALATLQTGRAWRPKVYRTLIEILLRRGCLPEARQLAEEAARYLKEQGGAGSTEVLLRVAVVEAHLAAHDMAAAGEVLDETLHLIERCADRIPDPVMRQRYRNAVRENVRAKELARLLVERAAPSMDCLC